MLGSSNLDGGDEVLLAVGPKLTDGQLRACEDDGLAQQAELRDATGAGTADDQVGSPVGSTHVSNKVGDFQL